MNDPNICLRCGLELPAGMPQDGCQRCLLHAGLMAADDEMPVPAEANPGTMIGRYKLLDVIGEGGFGVVWRAEQLEPVSRQVALKVIKPGMDTGEVVARFEAERQALAMMDHPNIARVFDGGATEGGRPFFVMELVQGVPITKFCEDSGLTVRQRIELFVDVLSALQHAHQKGIIHRDLKPSNILVSPDEDHPAVKIIDFGIARAISMELTGMAKFTLRGQIIGTPEYMSPEQAERKPQDVDTRSDIYSLGVVLYELLTGCTPLDHGALREAGYEEILRRIREEDPPKPSTRVTSLGDRRHKIASQQVSESAKVSRQLRGDLDWIVMKALEKDRTRRYETANGFAMDLRRFLASEPVTAAPPSTGYLLAKLVRRHRTAFAAGGAVVLTLITGICVSTWQAVRASHAEIQAKTSEQSAKQSEANALFDRASALQTAKVPGYRRNVWDCLHQVAKLDSARTASPQFRSLVISCLGDPLGLDPVKAPIVERTTSMDVPELLRHLVVPTLKTAVSGDGDFLALSDRLNRLELWGKDGRMVARVTPQSLIDDLKFTSNGRLLIGGCQEGTMAWSVPDLQIRAFFRGGVVQSVACQPGGHLMATFLPGARHFEVWSLASHRQTGSLPSPEGTAIVEFSADGRMLLAVSSEGKVISGWAVDRTPEKQYFEGHEGGIPAVAFSPDGRIMASVSKDRSVRLWDVQEGKLRHVCRGPKREIQDVAFSPDGRLLATADFEGDIWIWDPTTGKGFAAAHRRGPVWRLRFDSSGRGLFSGGIGGIVGWVVDASQTPTLITRCEISFKFVRDFAIHPDGSSLAVVSEGEGVFGCDITKGNDPQPLSLIVPAGIHALHFGGGGSRLLFATPDKRIGTWDFEKRITTSETSRIFAISPLSMPANEQWAAGMAPTSRMVTAYDLYNDRDVITLGPELNHIWCTEWTRDGSHLAVGLSDGGLAVWNLKEVRARLAEFCIDVPSTWEKAEAVTSLPNRTSRPQEEELKRLRNENGPTHPKTLMAMYKLASAQDAAGRPADATALRTEIEKIPPPRDQLDVSQLPLLKLWGQYHIRLGQWSEVAADLSRSLELYPNGPLAWSQLAVVLAETNDVLGYREHCRKMLSRFSSTTNPNTSHLVARSCLLNPLPGDEFAVACRLANQAVEKDYPDRDKLLVTKALAEYRQEHYEPAIDWSRKALAKGGNKVEMDAQVRAVLAMSLLQLGQTAEASAVLAEAAKGIETKAAEGAEAGARWIDFHNGLIAGILIREARALIDGKAAEM